MNVCQPCEEPGPHQVILSHQWDLTKYRNKGKISPVGAFFLRQVAEKEPLRSKRRTPLEDLSPDAKGGMKESGGTKSPPVFSR